MQKSFIFPLSDNFFHHGLHCVFNQESGWKTWNEQISGTFRQGFSRHSIPFLQSFRKSRFENLLPTMASLRNAGDTTTRSRSITTSRIRKSLMTSSIRLFSYIRENGNMRPTIPHIGRWGIKQNLRWNCISDRRNPLFRIFCQMQNLRNKNDACRMKEKSPEGKIYYSLKTVFSERNVYGKTKFCRRVGRFFSPILRSNMTS